MELTKLLCQLVQFTWCVLVLTGSVLNQEPTETSEPVGNYTITIKVTRQSGINSGFQFWLYGEHSPDTALKSEADCKNYPIPFTDIDDIGSICSVQLQVIKDKKSGGKPKCSIDKITIADHNRKTASVFNISQELPDVETLYQRTEPLVLVWRPWSEWQKCNCNTKTKTRTRTCRNVTSYCKNVVPCPGEGRESMPCACENAAEESSSSDNIIVIPIIAGIAVILIIVVVAGICYSRRINQRKAQGKVTVDSRQCGFPAIVITPPEDTDNTTTSPSNSVPNCNTSGEESSLITPVRSSEDVVIRHPQNDIEWEDNDLYVSARA